jgi:hypothetical protein
MQPVGAYGRSLGARRCILFTALNLVNSGTYSKLTLEFSRPYQRAGVPAARRMMYLSVMAVRSLGSTSLSGARSLRIRTNLNVPMLPGSL